ncbi:hypothetical protein ACX12M_10770 [Cellulosimicrobium cellulans]|uniref:Lipoprotein n=1 Tax=Cellulosimicrobium funkei TaxID=264251 RepID=A0A4Y8QWT7_9MICO|nr:hypothetical protein [Cellulosimicrobium funkei]TFF03591.1 hypothetical protein E1O70_19505 [Cellulosimicrobium funkei]TGA67187.1 hypothetical protein EQW79_019500 [Cellulosimicrobium terreum]
MRALRSRVAAVAAAGVVLVSVGACSADEPSFCDAARSYEATVRASTESLTRDEAADAFAQDAEAMREVTAPDALSADWDRVTTTASDVADALADGDDGTELLLDDDYQASFSAVTEHVKNSCS